MKEAKTRHARQVVSPSDSESESNRSTSLTLATTLVNKVSSCSILPNLGDSPSSLPFNPARFAVRNSTLW